MTEEKKGRRGGEKKTLASENGYCSRATGLPHPFVQGERKKKRGDSTFSASAGGKSARKSIQAGKAFPSSRKKGEGKKKVIMNLSSVGAGGEA